MVTLQFDYIRTMRVNGFTTISTLIVSVHAGAYGMGIYAIMLPSGVFSVAHCIRYAIMTYFTRFHDLCYFCSVLVYRTVGLLSYGLCIYSIIYDYLYL